jgi:biopolymer transport protein ExbD
VELRRSKREGRSVFVNVTSFIDVLFVLLLFFMVSTTFVSQPAMNLDLPKAVHSQATRQPSIVVYVREDGAVYLNDELVDVGLLEQALASRLASSTDKAVVLEADSRVSHGRVIEVLDVIKGAGAVKLTIATQPKS